ncbi:hypothetical protein ZANY_51 [Gordonia phage Zany]|uniref:Uncharacterized protein n=1 Tax=Gordonia phage Zany TaxID=2910759 RepID=A0AA49BNV5_9CAUD|nr:hypothetical protein ZANY_51 [Gordonia phage Zany]
MRIKFLDASNGLHKDDMGELWVEDIGSLPVMADAPMEDNGFQASCTLNEDDGCQRPAVFRVTTADGAPGPLWWYSCDFCMMELLRSSLVLEVRR